VAEQTESAACGRPFANAVDSGHVAGSLRREPQASGFTAEARRRGERRRTTFTTEARSHGEKPKSKSKPEDTEVAEHTELAACGRPFGDAAQVGGEIIVARDDSTE